MRKGEQKSSFFKWACIITNDEEMNVVELLDANYEKANLQECVNIYSNLDEIQKGMPLDLMMKYEDLFQGKKRIRKEVRLVSKSNLVQSHSSQNPTQSH